MSPTPYKWFLPFICIAALTTQGSSDPVPQKMEISQGGLGTFNLDWEGVTGRTYFMQFSLDLVEWHFAPFMHFGEGGHHRGFEGNGDKCFFRLCYGDIEGINSLDEAMNADFDGDGISNIFEVTHGYNPYQVESTSDGQDAVLDPDEDGLGNTAEQTSGTNPMSKDHPLLLLEVIVD